MKKIKIKLLGISFLMLSVLTTSCTEELNQSPESKDTVSGDELYSNPSAYKQTFSKILSGLATTGQQGPFGKPDITGLDEGETQYVRALWMVQELTTDEAVIGWGNPGAQDFHNQDFAADNAYLFALFSRFSFQIVNCNEFLRQTTDAKLASRGVDATTKAEVLDYRNQVRFLRALTYWHLIDVFGGGSLVTEDSPTSFYYPAYNTRAELYAFVDSELTEITPLLKAPKTNGLYGVDQAAAWMLHAKLYMNAGVYIGEDKYTEALPLINKIIASPYSLGNNYNHLFYADNDKNGSQNEFIFTIAFDGLKTQTYGGTTFLVHAPIGGKMNASEFGTNGGWSGVRTTSAFVDMFPVGNTDTRGIFFTDGQTKEIVNMSSFNNGYAVQKFRNINVDGTSGSDKTGEFIDCDFPMFRLGDVYLMYAECAARGVGDLGTATTYVNALRTRANASTISQNQLTLSFVLDERARELHFEGQRRTDLIRFGKFTGGSYLWPWKGGVPNGTPTQSYKNLFPIPTNALNANLNLIQNPGY